MLPSAGSIYFEKICYSDLLEAVTVLQHCRHHERTAILQQLRGETVRYDEEKGGS